MKIKIKVHTSTSQEKIERISDKEYEIWIKEKPVKGKANKELLKLLKKYFNKEVEIVSGESSKNKIINVQEN